MLNPYLSNPSQIFVAQKKVPEIEESWSRAILIVARDLHLGTEILEMPLDWFFQITNQMIEENKKAEKANKKGKR